MDGKNEAKNEGGKVFGGLEGVQALEFISPYLEARVCPSFPLPISKSLKEGYKGFKPVEREYRLVHSRFTHKFSD